MTDALRAVIWDVDGVLVVSGDIHYEAWRQVLAERGLTMRREQFEATFGMNNRGILRHIFGDRLSDRQVEEISARKEAAYREGMRGRVSPLPGVRDWLARLRAEGWRQAVASSGPMANIAATLDEFEMWDVFDAVVSGSRLAHSKPDPAIFLQAAAAVGVSPERAVVIEDGTVGIEAAQRAGMRSIAVTTTHPAAALRAADRIVDRLDRLPPDTFDLLVP